MERKSWAKPELIHISKNIKGGTLTGLPETQTFPTTGGGTVRGDQGPS